MPIDIDEFETASEEALRGGGTETERESVLYFLARNPSRAYAREEIRSATGVSTISLVHELFQLESEGLVRRRGRYWAVDPEAEVPGIESGERP